MEIVKTYGSILKSIAPKHPKAAFSMIRTGLSLECFRTKHLADKRMPLAYQKLNTLGMELSIKALKHPEQCVWTNLFTPTELFQCFDLNCLSIEFLASYISGFQCEDYFIDFAEQQGLAPALCSYHKTFIGTIDSGVIPPAGFASTTSMICDGNINTFRYICDKYHINQFMLDVPTEYSPEAVQYLTEQLKELTAILEARTGKKMDFDRLREIIDRENKSLALYREFLALQTKKNYPTTMTLSMFMLLATHLCIGSPEIYDFFLTMRQEIEAYPDFDGLRILWVHLFPFYQETLKEYFNYSDKYLLQTTEMHFDYMEELDTARPLETLARKLICNVYNAPYRKKAELVEKLAKEYRSDAVINFCHWGCKQSSGGVMLLREQMQKAGIPLLVLEGDAMDRRGSFDGQIRTRLEAFLEMVEQSKGVC
ncbi:MAG: 2-hydroxyacyl-CoA dehydratase [Eubacterium sp.]|nr:2-hydroxyacyl-CoA dehydratase [Eubacterium sp.]